MNGTLRHRLAWVLLLACVILSSAAFVVHETRNPPLQVKVASPAYADISNLVTTDGMVEPTLEFQARANFPGMIDKVPVELGTQVSAGQLLVTMKDPFALSRVAAAQAGLSFARRDEENTQRGGTQDERIQIAGDLLHARSSAESEAKKLATLEELQQHGAASSAEVEGSRARVRDSEATVATLEKRQSERFSPAEKSAVQSHVEDARVALGAAKETYRNANIESPMAGTVYSVSVSPYDFVAMGADLLRVADLSRVQVRAHFDEPEVGKLKAGQSVTITWEGRPGLKWHGHIRQAPVAAIALGSRSVAECLITVDDAKGDLLPNTHVLVTVPIEEHRHVLTLPRDALQADGRGTSVFRVVDGRLVQTPVVVGLVNLDMVEIVRGVSPDDVIALHSMTLQPLTDKLSVAAVR